ncbi:hypothetical protein BH23GEM8_BH23GEM8_04790 [soil metagenome]
MTIGLLAIVAIALFAAGFAQLLAPIERPDPERQFLSAEQRELADRVRESRDFVSEQQRLMGEIAGLQAKMREVDPELYRGRIERLDSARALLEKQIRIERDLVVEYERAERILDVEIETERVVGQLGDEVLEAMSQRLAELDAARDANRELRYQLEANEEVERLLSGRSGI